MNKIRRTVLIPAVLIVAALPLVFYFLVGSSSDAPSDTNKAQTNTTAAPATPSLTIQPGAPSVKETPKASSEQLTVKIRGTIRKEGNSDADAAGAIVALYNGDKRGTMPQAADSSGRFEFSNVPLRADNTYTLQAKIPGLCAEEPISLQAVDSQNVITKDVILKQCAIGTSSAQPHKPEPTPLTDISTGIRELKDSVNSIASTLGSAITFCLILIVLSLLSVTVMAFRLDRRFANDNPRIDLLYQWKAGIDTALSELAHPRPPAQPVLALTTELSQMLTNLTLGMKQLVAVIPNLAQSASEGSTSRPTTAERQNERARQTPFGTQHSEPSQSAIEWYRSLIMFGQASPPAIYLEINYNRSDRSRVESNPQISFDVRPYLGSFVLLCDFANQSRGWVFPNPSTNFAADHTWVFSNLNATNFLKELANLKPKELRLNDGVWQLNL